MNEVGRLYLSDDCLIAAVVTDGGKNFALAGAGIAGMFFYYFKLVVTSCLISISGDDQFGCIAHLLNLCIHDALGNSVRANDLVIKV